MPVTFTKARAYATLAANGITDVVLNFTNRNESGVKAPFRKWTASVGSGSGTDRIAESRHLIEVVREVIQCRKK